MDWGNVQVIEILNSLREADWRQRPRPLGEFATGFSPAQNTAKLQARIKCNVYNFRANYFLAVLAMETLCVLCIRGLTGTLALLLGTFGILCLNDTFAGSVSGRVLRLIRRVNPPMAHRMRAISGGYGGLGAPGTAGDISMLGAKRKLVVLVFLVLGSLLMWQASAILAFGLGMVIGDALVLAHASMKVPNLKVRLASAREEFRAVFRGYHQQDFADHTL